MSAQGRTSLVGGRIGDPTRETVGQPVPVILPDPPTLFARRAGRLEGLAVAHPMTEWLRFMARIAHAQRDAVIAMPAPGPVTMVAGQPPLDAKRHQREPYWQQALAIVLCLDGSGLPEQTGVAIDALRRRDADALETLADDYLHGEMQGAQSGEAVFAAAALAAYFVHRAAALPAAEVHLLAQRSRCPVCGCAPVAGVITAAGRTPGLRYLHCGLCATAWNHVRAVCIACGGSRGIALHGIEGGDGLVQAETCDECHGYAKLLYQAKDMAVEPMADDLASLGLDMLVGEAGYRRHAANPLIP